MNNLNRNDTTLNLTKQLLNQIKAGDLDHGLSIAEMLLSEGPNFDPELLIVIIESIIELTAQSGSLSAKEHLKNTWPILRDNHLRRLRNKSIIQP